VVSCSLAHTLLGLFYNFIKLKHVDDFQDESASAAMLSVELDDQLGGAPTQHRSEFCRLSNFFNIFLTLCLLGRCKRANPPSSFLISLRKAKAVESFVNLWYFYPKYRVV
jgi:hypothetical protein